MNKFLPAFAVLIVLCSHSLSAQNKTALIQNQKNQIERLQHSLDSLQVLFDSLQVVRNTLADTLLQESEAIQNQIDTVATRSLHVTDSLVALWYKNQTLTQTVYDTDATLLCSNVPDSELESRLKAMNSFITLPFNETVKHYMLLYTDKKRSSLDILLGKSKYYFPIFEECFARYNLPLELKYLAVIESRLVPTARSKAGATGIWQFMYSTAIGYGLKINSFVDERMDVQKSTEAAARYLRDAYKVFGDWNLAICSYNCGAANVQKAIHRAGSRKFWDVYEYLPHETRSYVPAFVGVMYAFKYAREYGIEPAEVGMPAVCDTFQISKNLHFRQIQETVGVPMEWINKLNPQYTHNIIPGSEGTYTLRLPYEWSANFVDTSSDSLYNYKSSDLLNPQVLKNISESGRERRITYKVKSGDILGRIAANNGVKVSDIKKWNHLHSDTIRPGQILYIYKK